MQVRKVMKGQYRHLQVAPELIVSKGSLFLHPKAAWPASRFFSVPLLALTSLLVAPVGFARDRVQATVVEDAPIIIYHNTPDQRRAELRRALTSGAELPQSGGERRRLSAAERDALNQDLRDAVRDAYRQRGLVPR